MYSSNEINFVHKDVTLADIILLLGPFTDADPYNACIFDDSHSMAHLMHKAGCFKSISDAKRNGWDKPVPRGYSQVTVGKKRFKVYIVNTFEEDTIDKKD